MTQVLAKRKTPAEAIEALEIEACTLRALRQKTATYLETLMVSITSSYRGGFTRTPQVEEAELKRRMEEHDTVVRANQMPMLKHLTEDFRWQMYM